MDESAREITSQSAAPPLPRWAESLTRFLDDLIRVPGTRVGIGADAVVGFFLPGVGDALTGVGSIALLVLALRSGVPTVVLLRMVGHIALDVVVGSIPGLGDVFDLFYKSNRKNLELIRHYRDDPNAQPSAADYAIVGSGIVLAVLAVVLPLVYLGMIMSALANL